MKKKEFVPVKLELGIESPTLGDLKSAALGALHALGGFGKAVNKLSFKDYYTLSLVSSLILDEEKEKAFIFGKKTLTT
jgi:hypothetical protein